MWFLCEDQIKLLHSSLWTTAQTNTRLLIHSIFGVLILWFRRALTYIHVGYFQMYLSVLTSLTNSQLFQPLSDFFCCAIPSVCILLSINSRLCFWASFKDGLFSTVCAFIECGCIVFILEPRLDSTEDGFFFTQTSEETRPYWDTLLGFQFLSVFRHASSLFQTSLVFFHFLSACHSFSFSPLVYLWESGLACQIFGGYWDETWHACLVDRHAVAGYVATAKQVYTSSLASITVISPSVCIIVVSSIALTVSSSPAWLQPVNHCCPLHQLSLHYVSVSCSSNTMLLISYNVFSLSS